jgi:hypothetical protein
MKRVERINCIKIISDNLAEHEWPDIDLILGQFQLPTSDSWDNSKRSYLMHHLKDAHDQVLIEMMEAFADYVVPFNSGEQIIIDDDIWLPGRFRLFISHLSCDKDEVIDLKSNLKSYGIDCFVAHQDINPSIEWQSAIELALHTCDALSAFLTSDFHKSNWTDQEIGFCLARRVLVLPLKVNINPYGFINKYQALNCLGVNASKTSLDIFDILIKHPLTSAKLSSSLIANFVESDSFESAKTRSLLLQKIETWTPEMLRNIESSLETNSQIANAFNVPGRIKLILEKHSQKDVFDIDPADIPF